MPQHNRTGSICSAGNFRSTGDAIQETPPTVFFKPDCIVAWYEGLTA